MSKKEESTAVVRVHDRFQALAMSAGGGAIANVIAENLGGTMPSLFELEKIRVGAGGAQCYTIGNPATGDQTVAAFEAVIVGMRGQRAWWRDKFGAGSGSTPPDCSCDNVATGKGKGNNGDGQGIHDCETCHNNAWGTGTRADGTPSRGKACRQFMAVLLLREGAETALLPSVLIAPPGSLKGLRQYLVALSSKGIVFGAAMHRFATAKQPGPPAYTSVAPSFVRMLEQGEIDALGRYAAAIREAVMVGVHASAGDFGDHGSDAEV